jgi:hypothetical protein
MLILPMAGLLSSTTMNILVMLGSSADDLVIFYHPLVKHM